MSPGLIIVRILKYPQLLGWGDLIMTRDLSEPYFQSRESSNRRRRPTVGQRKAALYASMKAAIEDEHFAHTHISQLAGGTKEGNNRLVRPPPPSQL